MRHDAKEERCFSGRGPSQCGPDLTAEALGGTKIIMKITNQIQISNKMIEYIFSTLNFKYHLLHASFVLYVSDSFVLTYLGFTLLWTARPCLWRAFIGPGLELSRY